MEQETVNFGSNDKLLGILTKPDTHDLTRSPLVIMLNAGILHRVGPNRISTELAFCLAENKVPSFRFDFSGIGDSELYSIEESAENDPATDCETAIRFLENEYGVQQFILFGLCSGAEVAFKVAVQNIRVIGACLVNGTGVALKDIGVSYQAIVQKTTKRYYQKVLSSPDKWLHQIANKNFKTFADKGNIAHLTNKVKLLLQKSPQSGQTVTKQSSSMPHEALKNWEILLLRNVFLYQIFSEGSNVFDIYTSLPSNSVLTSENAVNKLEVDIIKDVDHNFTPVWSQQVLISRIVKWVTHKFSCN